MKHHSSNACRGLFILGLLAATPLACGSSQGGTSPSVAGSSGLGAASGASGAAAVSGAAGAGVAGSSGAGSQAGAGGMGGVVAEGGHAGAGGAMMPIGPGASVPFTAYEAEDMITTGTLLGPSRTWGEVASEASGRKAVRLSAVGQYLRFTTAGASNSIVVRYSVPDGTDAATLTFSVAGGAEKKLNVTSKYVWSYGDMSGQPPAFNQPAQNDPGQGHPHHFFDEVHLLVPEGIPAGSVVELKKATGDSAANYDIDLVELEQVGDALPMPAGFKSIVDCGANGDDTADDSAAFQSCIDAPHGAGLYIPPGRFLFLKSAVNVANVAIRGAGMWRSTIGGPKARFVCTNDNCKYYDFALFGETTARDDDQGGADDAAFNGPKNSGVVLDHIWVEHRRIGFWSGLYPDSGSSNVSIKDCRFRNLHADGVNFYGGITNSVIDNCHFRNTGDDAIASWSHGADAMNGHAPNSGNTFQHNTIQAPWMANCIGIYGGGDLTVSDNLCSDAVQLAGFLVAQDFDSHPFSGSHNFTRNSLVRDGGNYIGVKWGAVELEPKQGNVAGVSFTDLKLVDSTYYGIAIGTGNSVDSITVTNASIAGSGEFAIFVPTPTHGMMTLNTVTVSKPALFDDPGNQFTVVQGMGNVGF